MIDLAELQMGPRRFLDARRRELAALRFDRIAVKPLAPSIGGEISGVDLREPLDDATFAEIERALLEYKVVFFRDQDITPDQQVAFAEQFGSISIPPMAPKGSRRPELMVLDQISPKGEGADNWHSDNWHSSNWHSSNWHNSNRYRRGIISIIGYSSGSCKYHSGSIRYSSSSNSGSRKYHSGSNRYRSGNSGNSRKYHSVSSNIGRLGG